MLKTMGPGARIVAGAALLAAGLVAHAGPVLFVIGGALVLIGLAGATKGVR